MGPRGYYCTQCEYHSNNWHLANQHNRFTAHILRIMGRWAAKVLTTSQNRRHTR